jgi:hypothetical protein
LRAGRALADANSYGLAHTLTDAYTLADAHAHAYTL